MDWFLASGGVFGIVLDARGVVSVLDGVIVGVDLVGAGG